MVCMDQRLNLVNMGRKEFRTAGSAIHKFGGGDGPDYDLWYALGVVYGSTVRGENAVLMVTGHSDCKANSDLFEALTGAGRTPHRTELARIPQGLQASLLEALGNNADKAELIDAMTKVLALQNMQNLLEYHTRAGAMDEMLASEKVFSIVAVIHSETRDIEIYDWEKKAYAPLAQIMKDAEKEVAYSPAAAPGSFVMMQGATTTTVAEFFGKELLGTIKAAVEKIGNMKAPGVGNG
ncbi:MAG: hypothetical protein EB060_06395 [Proteobacteria bacterium]|nr:hypothetical protein [Pseudomonadota bacterium]